MAFNSWSFILFFPLVCIIYWMIGSQRWRNMLLLVASYYFYMSWDASYGLLLLASTVISYVAALVLQRSNHKKAVLAIGLVLNLGLLFFFKYLGFATYWAQRTMEAVGMDVHFAVPEIMLPVGISFFVFQSVGYAIDVYRGDTPAERNFVTFALFISFFPQLVAGPIERSGNMLPQFREHRHFSDDQALAGFKLMLWGYFMKLVLADQCGVYVDSVFNCTDPSNHSTLLALILFTFQIYGDFAGYTYIAIGAAAIMGFHLNDNFHRPFFAISISDFWRRWHISLSTWFRDYLYIPLGGNRKGGRRTYFNLIVTFLVSGLWHGANYTFIAWGAIHGICICVERLLGWNRKAWHGISHALHTIGTFVIVVFAYVIFRADSLQQFKRVMGEAIDPANFTFGNTSTIVTLCIIAVAIVVVMTKEAIEEYRPQWLTTEQKSLWRDVAIITLLLVSISFLYAPSGGRFVYFQF